MYPRSVPAPIRCQVFAMRRVHMRHAQYAMHSTTNMSIMRVELSGVGNLLQDGIIMRDSDA